MPMYEYRCATCGSTLAIHASITVDRPLPPDCSQCVTPMTRIYTAPGIGFKGTGWGKDGK